MTKTKSQLRAEAVGRLREMKDGIYGFMEVLHTAIGWNGYANADTCRDTLIDLLTDECDTECYVCSRLAELVAENCALRSVIDLQSRQTEDIIADFNNNPQLLCQKAGTKQEAEIPQPMTDDADDDVTKPLYRHDA